MDKDLRASLSAAGAAAALSALVGVIAGVGVLSLFLRALGCGVFVGASTYGIILLLRKTVPGLPELVRGGEPSADPDPERGSRVDIVLPGEELDLGSLSGEGASPERGAAVPGNEPGRAPDDDEPSEVSELGDEALLDAEPAGPEAESAIPPASAAGAGQGALPVSRNAGDKERRSAVGFDELDVLPDLDGFTDSFTASEFSSGGLASEGSERQPRASGGGSAPRPGQEGLDPASLAQAVRTILKRDQKG